jgi:hypothetical protein
MSLISLSLESVFIEWFLRATAQEPSTHCKKAGRRLRPDCDRLQKTEPDCGNRGMAEAFEKKSEIFFKLP